MGWSARRHPVRSGQRATAGMSASDGPGAVPRSACFERGTDGCRADPVRGARAAGHDRRRHGRKSPRVGHNPDTRACPTRRVPGARAPRRPRLPSPHSRRAETARAAAPGRQRRRARSALDPSPCPASRGNVPTLGRRADARPRRLHAPIEQTVQAACYRDVHRALGIRPGCAPRCPGQPMNRSAAGGRLDDRLAPVTHVKMRA